MRKMTLILLLAFALRLGWALLVPVSPISDSAMYDAFAREIAAGNGYMFPGDSPTVYWPVGPAALYGFFYAMSGAGGWSVALPNIAMGVAMVWLIGLLGRQMFGERVGLWAALLAAIWPLWIQFTTVLNSELPFVMLLSAALVIHLRKQDPWVGRVVLTTILLVGAAFMRPTAIPIILILPAIDIVMHRSLRRSVMETGLALLVAATLFSPWAMRNQALFGAPVLVSANFGANLWMGNNPHSNGGYMPLPEIGIKNEVVRDDFFKEQAFTFIRENPLEYVVLCLKRIPVSFGRETIGVAWNELKWPSFAINLTKLISSAYWLLLLAAAVFGAARYIIDRPIRILNPSILVSGLFTAVAILVVGQDRYHMSLAPFVAIFAAYGLDRLAKRYLGRRHKSDHATDHIAIAN